MKKNKKGQVFTCPNLKRGKDKGTFLLSIGFGASFDVEKSVPI